ncbi:MAG: cell division protein FtsZ, partial [Sphingobacteriaceae bacterium]|nr:cell division protein FtsZ [Sphingobacteriaceae bacterium]
VPEKEIETEVKHNDDSTDDKIQKARENVMKLRDMTMRMRSAGGLQELENEPAYKRKQMQLEQIQHSSQSHVSRFTLTDENGQTEIKQNNSFLHDNVD